MKKRLLLLLVTLMICIGIFPLNIFAASAGSISSDMEAGADTAQNKSTVYAEVPAGDIATEVYLTVDDSDLVVSVPTTIVLSGNPNNNGEYIGNYSVSVNGDMSGSNIVSIEPENRTVALKQNGSKDSSVTLTQEQTEFDSNDFSNNKTVHGCAIAKGLTAGKWNGSTNFIISMNSRTVPADYAVLYEYDLSATDNDDVKAYYCVPNKNTSKLTIEEAKSMRKARSNASKASSVEYNGVVYELSDEDTLIVSGNGEMKENIQADFVDYAGIKNDVLNYFSGYNLGEAIHYSWNGNKFNWKSDSPNYDYLIYFDTNISNIIVYKAENIENSNFYNTYNSTDGLGGSDTNQLKDEISEYINRIYSQYGIQLPNKVEIRNGVTNVSENAFLSASNLLSVDIADSVTNIDYNAFKGCTNLSNIVIPNSVTTIGSSAFRDCTSLTEIVIPNSVKAIHNYAFAGCTELSKVELSQSLSKLSGGIFQNCNKLTSISLPDSITGIDISAFQNCTALMNVYLPDKLTNIGTAAFSGCPLQESFTLPDSVVSIGYGTFDNCTIRHFNTGNGIDNDNLDNLIKSLKRTNTLETLIIGNNVTALKANQFRDFTSLSQIQISDSVTDIGNGCFYGCTGLTAISIPDSVTSIGDMAFQDCKSLNDITLSSNLNSIGNQAFYRVAKGSVIHCKSSNVADLLIDGSNYYSSFSTIDF